VVEQAIRTTHRAGKPIGALCISPVLIAKVLGDVTVTIGSDSGTAADIGKLGGKHENRQHGEVTVDRENLIVTAPCYMLNASISEIADDAEAVVITLMKLSGKKQ
jgi:enhancing lycopene biosynthesis protein 2